MLAALLRFLGTVLRSHPAVAGLVLVVPAESKTLCFQPTMLQARYIILRFELRLGCHVFFKDIISKCAQQDSPLPSVETLNFYSRSAS